MSYNLKFHKMKIKIKFVAILIASGIFLLNSCKKDEETSNLVVTLTELGLNNSKIAYIGSDLHVEADIVAEAGINTVKIEIHPEGSATWEFNAPYTEFTGLKNTSFHKHIDIPLTAEAGEYHFHFIVTDKNDNSVVVESEFEIKQPTDGVAPQNSVTSSPANGQSFSNGEIISISGTVSDDLALGGIYIGLVRENQNLSDAEVNTTNTITILHTHNFDSPTSHNFLANITVGASKDNDITPKDISGEIAWQSANYYIIIKCKDAFGGNWTFSSHYPIVINY